MKQMADYIDAKNIREFLALAKGQKGLFEDETSFDRKGKRRFMPENVIRYQEKLSELKERLKQRKSESKHEDVVKEAAEVMKVSP